MEFSISKLTDTELLQLLEQGYTYQQIANRCGVSRQRIHQRVKNINPKEVYYDQDITFCSNKECKNKKCRRHYSHADWSVKPFHSFANFENTQYCLNKRSDI